MTALPQAHAEHHDHYHSLERPDLDADVVAVATAVLHTGRRGGC